METKVYAGRIKDKDILMQSSSGGAFTAISDYFISIKGAVVCTTYDYDTNRAVFSLIENKSIRDAARGSKYMQSYAGDIFHTAYKWLLEHPERELLFVGMGCQADGFRKYAELKGIRDRVTIVDIICHGVASPQIWKEYADKYSKLEFLSFKDKRLGWYHPTPIAVMDGEEISISDYVKVFYTANPLRLSCYECPFTNTSRKTDITIGDFWHIEKIMPEFYDPNGTSVFLIHSPKGQAVFDHIRGNILYRESDVSSCWQENLEKPTGRPSSREAFWKYYRINGIKKTIVKYSKDPLSIKIRYIKNDIKSKIKRIIRGI